MEILHFTTNRYAKRSYDVSLITQNVDKKYTEYNRQMFHFREGLAKQAGYYYTFQIMVV